MRKSIAGFILGLIGSIICLGWGFYSGFIGDLVNGISSAIDDTTVIPLLSQLGWLCFFGSIAGIVGASLCFRKARVGAILLTIATATCLPVIIYCLSEALKSGIFISTIGVFCIVPIGLMISAVITAFCAKPIESKVKGENED